MKHFAIFYLFWLLDVHGTVFSCIFANKSPNKIKAP